MLRVTILAVGTLKERYWNDACAEYRKRLSGCCKLTVIEVPEHRLPLDPSPARIEQGLAAEGKSIFAKLPQRARLIALCVEGTPSTSEGLAAELAGIANGAGRVVFVIGGSHGLSGEVKQAAHSRMSMSGMTFPHQMTRVMLLEQLYRAFSILGGGKYHK